MNAASPRITRRRWIRNASASAAALALLPAAQWLRAAEPAAPAAAAAATAPATTARSDLRYKIAASDWMMLKRQTPGALTRAKEAGLDGVEVDMGPLGKRVDLENKLRDDEFRAKYLEQARSLGLEISSLAMSAFYGQPVADHPKAEQFCNDWIALMPQIGTNIGFLPVIFKKDDERPAAIAKVVALFRKVAPRAEQAKVILGLNTPLDAAGNVEVLDAIGSPAVRIAYNCGEATDEKRDVYAELQTLGRDRIAQVIPTLSDGVWLEHDKRLDVPKLKQVLDEIGWRGWLVLQRSRDAKRARDVAYNFGGNGKYLKSIFQA